MEQTLNAFKVGDVLVYKTYNDGPKTYFYKVVRITATGRYRLQRLEAEETNIQKRDCPVAHWLNEYIYNVKPTNVPKGKTHLWKPDVFRFELYNPEKVYTSEDKYSEDSFLVR